METEYLANEMGWTIFYWIRIVDLLRYSVFL